MRFTRLCAGLGPSGPCRYKPNPRGQDKVAGKARQAIKQQHSLDLTMMLTNGHGCLVVRHHPRHGHVSAENPKLSEAGCGRGKQPAQLNLARDVARCGRVWAKLCMVQSVFSLDRVICVARKSGQKRGEDGTKTASDMDDQIRVGWKSKGCRDALVCIKEGLDRLW